MIYEEYLKFIYYDVKYFGFFGGLKKLYCVVRKEVSFFRFILGLF